MIKVLITGSNGFVGRHLKNYLLDNSSDRGKYIVSEFDLAFGQDVRNFESIRTAIDEFQPDLIFHLAAQAYVPESTMNPKRGIETNLIGTLNVLESIRQTGMHSRLHIAGTSEEYGYDRDDSELTEDSVALPTTPYGVTKLAATTLGMTYSRQYGMNVVATRAWNHIGPGASPSYAVSAFAKRVAEAEKYGSEVIHGNLEAVRNYTDVRDIVEAYVKLINQESGIYNLCSTESVSAKKIMDQLISFSKTKIKTAENPHLFRPMSNKFPKPNCEKARKTTGWSPKLTLDKTLQDTLDYWRALV